MNKTFRIILTLVGFFVISSALLLTGFVLGRTNWSMLGFWPGSMVNSFAANQNVPVRTRSDFSADPDMMATNGQNYYANSQFGYDMMGAGMGNDMMGGYGSDYYGNADPISMADAQTAVENYLASLGNDDLDIGEIMVFDNHAYAQIVERSTGIGAMEVLVDPATQTVYPEQGPNMMWNLKYGMMSGNGGYNMMGSGMMGTMNGNNYGFGSGMMGSIPSVESIPAEMTVTPEQAVESAQSYLDANWPGFEADEHADPFYGYYTLHILKDGQTVGMLSVNGYTRQVFPHTWHGEFIEMN